MPVDKFGRRYDDAANNVYGDGELNMNGNRITGLPSNLPTFKLVVSIDCAPMLLVGLM